MAYGDHNYTREEVHQILYRSERRKRPTGAHTGHPISRHTEQREDPFDRRNIFQDSTFVTRKHLILALHEALNSANGKTELRKLNQPTKKKVTIKAPIVEYDRRILANVVRNPMAKVGKKTVAAQGPQQLLRGVWVSSVTIVVDRLKSAEGNIDIHIQTAYPRTYCDAHISDSNLTLH